MARKMASPGPGECGCHLCLTRAWGHRPLVGLLDLVNLVLTWSSPSPGVSGTTWAYLDLVNLIPIWASPRPVDFVPHQYLIGVDSFFASPGTGDSEPICASPRSGDSGPHLGIIGTW